MTLKKIMLFFVMIATFSMNSQTENSELFTIDSKPVYTSEFLNVYNKNLHILTDDSQKDKANYLDLFVNYKLKVQQAKDLGYDTLPNYVKELATYKKQLMEPYLRDNSVEGKLLDEAYQRSLKEISASHILVKINPAKPNDTITAYKKINEARAKIIDGAKFEEVAVQYSEDPSVARNNGKLGYFTVFNMVYPFENAVYTTEVGNVSKPFKTRYGYHIVKINDVREAKGKVEAAHIMIKGDSLSSETKIREIYQQLQQGEDFKFLAKTLSDDKFSAQKEGSLGIFGSGRMVKEFEDVAFSLDVGKVSEPFKTSYGWHIVTVIKKYPIEDFESSKEKLLQEVKRSDRSKIVSNSIVPKLEKEFEITVNEKEVARIKSGVNSSTGIVVLTIEGFEIKVEELNKYLSGKPLSDKLFDTFKNEQILAYYKTTLEKEGTEFNSVFKEYKEGLLLFELLQSKIWNKSKDSVGVANYYAEHTSDYIKEKSFDGVVAICNDKKSAKSVKKQLEKKVALEALKKSVNSEEVVNVIFKEGSFNADDAILPEGFKFKEGISEIIEDNNRFIVVNATAINTATQQELEDVRGLVINDYQTYLEEQWLVELHKIYTVEMNDKVLKSVLEN